MDIENPLGDLTINMPTLYQCIIVDVVIIIIIIIIMVVLFLRIFFPKCLNLLVMIYHRHG